MLGFFQFNTIYTIASDKGKYTLIPTSIETKEEAGLFKSSRKKK